MNLNIDRQAAREEMARLKGQLDGLKEALRQGEQRLKAIEEAIESGPEDVPGETIQGRGFLYHEVEELLEPILSALRLSPPILAGAPHYADLIDLIAIMVAAMMDIIDGQPEKKKEDGPCSGQVWEAAPSVGREVLYLRIEEVADRPTGSGPDTYICHSVTQPHRRFKVERSELLRCVEKAQTKPAIGEIWARRRPGLPMRKELEHVRVVGVALERVYVFCTMSQKGVHKMEYIPVKELIERKYPPFLPDLLPQAP